MLAKMWFIKAWNVDGALQNPKNITVGSKSPRGGDEGGFPLVFLTNVDVVIAPSDVKLCEEGGILHVINEFRDKRQRVCIPDGVGIKISVVLARA